MKNKLPFIAFLLVIAFFASGFFVLRKTAFVTISNITNKPIHVEHISFLNEKGKIIKNIKWNNDLLPFEEGRPSYENYISLSPINYFGPSLFIEIVSDSNSIRYNASSNGIRKCLFRINIQDKIEKSQIADCQKTSAEASYFYQ